MKYDLIKLQKLTGKMFNIVGDINQKLEEQTYSNKLSRQDDEIGNKESEKSKNI